jgi:hypothetical protein
MQHKKMLKAGIITANQNELELGNLKEMHRTKVMKSEEELEEGLKENEDAK